jgi:hypothetical protein
MTTEKFKLVFCHTRNGRNVCQHPPEIEGVEWLGINNPKGVDPELALIRINPDQCHSCTGLIKKRKLKDIKLRRNCMYVYLSKFERQGIDFANYVNLPDELVASLIACCKEAWDAGYDSTNKLEACCRESWEKSAHLHSIHKENPYVGEYYSWCRFPEGIPESFVEHFYTQLSAEEQERMVTIYQSNISVCIYETQASEFPLVVDILPSNGCCVEIAKPLRVERYKNTFIPDKEVLSFCFDNGVGFNFVNNPKGVDPELDYFIEFFGQFKNISGISFLPSSPA